MARRILATVVALFIGCHSALAADLVAEPVQQRNLFGRCSYLNNIWLFGDPTDCPGDEDVPLCDSHTVVAAAKRFTARAEPVYRVPRVSQFVPVREVTATVYNPSPLVRRYCLASVELDNGQHTDAHYFVEEDSGFASISWSVYVCLDGYDPWRVYDGRCRVARPAPPR